ncbi:MAG TPA: glycosyltransferase family 9 protein [Chthoniobacter sp.]
MGSIASFSHVRRPAECPKFIIPISVFSCLYAAYALVRRLFDSFNSHVLAFAYALKVLIPIIIRTGRRPVVFSRYTGMGDIICTVPAARQLMQRHAGTTFIYNCHRNFAELPRIAGVADQVTSLKSIGQIGHWYRFLLGGFYDFAHGDDVPGRTAREPMVADFCRQFEVAITDQHPELAASPEATARARRILIGKGLDLSDLILIHPGPSWAIKEWPRELWMQLVAGLRSRGHTQIAHLGVGNYAHIGQTTVAAIPGTISLVDCLSIEECIAAISLARLVVGIDSGLLHIAASTRTPAVGLFGPTDPQFFYEPEARRQFVRTEVECAGCEHRRPRLHWLMGCPYNVKCMQSIDVEQVLQKCLECLKTAEPSAAGSM